jgi:hypothetical protein
MPSEMAVRRLAVRNPDDMYDQLPITDRIQDSIPSLADSIMFVTGKLLRACGARILDQRFNAFYDAPAIRFGRYRFEFLDGGFLYSKAIACHAVSNP